MYDIIDLDEQQLVYNTASKHVILCTFTVTSRTFITVYSYIQYSPSVSRLICVFCVCMSGELDAVKGHYHHESMSLGL